MLPSDQSELDRLRKENRLLNEQVKALVRAERSLAVSHRALDRHLQRVEALNRFALEASGAGTPSEILALAVDTLLSMVPFEQAVAFLRRDDGPFVAEVSRSIRGREAARSEDEPREAWNALGVTGGDLPARPLVAPSRRMRAESPALGPFVEYVESIFATPGEDRPEGAALLALPVGPEGGRPFALLLLRRATPVLSLLEELPGEADLPFLHLVAAHIASAVQNVLLVRETREALRVRDEFLSIASHELRTPLTAIQLQVQRLRTKALEGPVATTVAVLERQCRRLGRLIQQLLDVSQIQAGPLSLQPSDVDLTQLVYEVVEQYRDDLARSGSHLSVLAPGPVQARCDRLMISHVLGHLLSNAIKFGEGKPITVGIEGEPGKARVRVRDEGRGLSPADQSRVFDRFQRAVSSHHYGGLGLGLYLSRRIIEAHGGRIGIRSGEGQGAEFGFELPRVQGGEA